MKQVPWATLCLVWSFAHSEARSKFTVIATDILFRMCIPNQRGERCIVFDLIMSDYHNLTRVWLQMQPWRRQFVICWVESNSYPCLAAKLDEASAAYQRPLILQFWSQRWCSHDKNCLWESVGLRYMSLHRGTHLQCGEAHTELLKSNPDKSDQTSTPATDAMSGSLRCRAEPEAKNYIKLEAKNWSNRHSTVSAVMPCFDIIRRPDFITFAQKPENACKNNGK